MISVKHSIKKAALAIILGLVLGIFGTLTVLAASNPYPKKQTIEGVTTVPCTYVAWQEAYERTGIALPSWGNAVDWYSKARRSGYSVGTTPRKNSIAVYSGGGYGHVAYVVSVDTGSERMHVKEGGVTSYTVDKNGDFVAAPANGNGISESDIGYKVGNEYNGRYLTGFIYLDEPVKNPVSSAQNPPVTASPPTVSNQTPSNSPTTADQSNSYLKSLTADAFSIEFEKTTFTYYCSVPHEAEKVTISGEAESPTAGVTGCGEYPLAMGENTITVTVTAGDKSVSNYVIYITRKGSDGSGVVTSEALKKENNGNSTRPVSFYLMIIIPVLIAAAALAGFLLLKNSRKKKNKSGKAKE